MQKFFKVSLFLLAIGLIFNLGSIKQAQAQSIAAPTLLKINSFKSYTVADPVISGVTPSNTNVLVYVDGVFAGNARVQESNKTSQSFYFQIFNLSVGQHGLYLIAEDKNSLLRSAKSKVTKFSIADLPAPTLVVPNESTITGKVKPLIEGFAKSGSFVHIYIDGIYNGKTAIVEHQSGTAHFSYKPFLNLTVGQHSMWAVSEDLKGRKSPVSRVVKFRIEKFMPAPTIYKPVINQHTDWQRPFIVGLSKNNSHVRVYLDHRFDGEFAVRNDKSGTANFAYQPTQNLKSGKHFVYVTALDARGKESQWSNIIYFDISQVYRKPTAKQAIISESGVSEDREQSETVSKIDSQNKQIADFLVFAELYEKDNDLRLSNKQYKELAKLLNTETDLNIGQKDLTSLQKLLESQNIAVKNKSAENKNIAQNKENKNELDNKKLQDILNNDSSSTEDKIAGDINENKTQQDRLGWNAFIFLLFLAAVIAWIFWVNRELIKEKQAQNEEIDQEKENKNK